MSYVSDDDFLVTGPACPFCWGNPHEGDCPVYAAGSAMVDDMEEAA